MFGVRRGGVLLAAAAALSMVGVSALPSASAFAGVAGVTAGTLLPQRMQFGISPVELRSASPGYVAYTYGQADEYSPPQQTVHRLSDGAAVRVIGSGPGDSKYEPFLSGSSVVQMLPDRSDVPAKVTIHDVVTGQLTGTVSLPATDRVVAVSETGAVTVRSDSAGTGLHVLRPDGTDTEVTGPVPDSWVGAVPAGDERTVVFHVGGQLWALDLASGTETELADSVDFYAWVVLSPTRVYWISHTYGLPHLVSWAGRDGTPGGQVSVPADWSVQGYQALGDGLVAVRQGSDSSHVDLDPVDLTSGVIGAPLVHDAVDSADTGDGSIALVLDDNATRRIATLAPGSSTLRPMAELPPIATQAQKVGLSGSRTVVDFGSPYGVGGPVATLSGSQWAPGLGSGQIPGGLGSLAGDVLLTQLSESTSSAPATYQLSWPGGSRTVSGNTVLGHDGRLTAVVKDGTVTVEDTRNGAVRTSFAAAGAGLWALDSTLLWRWSPTKPTLTGTDFSGAQPARTVTAPCTAWQYGPFSVAGRWALLTCADGATWAVDLHGSTAPWKLPAGDGAVLGNGFVAELRTLTDSSGGDYHVVAAMSLASGHAEKLYGPVHGRYNPPNPSIAADDGGSARLVYLDGRRQVRRVSLDWLPAPVDVDHAAPTLAGLYSTPRVAPTSTVSIAWSYRDVGTAAVPASGLRSVDVRYRQRPAAASTYGPWIYPADRQATTATSERLTAARGSDTCWQVRARDDAGNISAWTPERCSQVDGTAPVITAATAGFRVAHAIHTTTVRFSYAGTDDGALRGYDVGYRIAPPGEGFGAWTYPTTWQNSQATAQSRLVAAGGDICWRVRAHDAEGNVSAWTSQRCAAVPVDDRALAVSGPVARGAAATAFGGTITTLSHAGAAVQLAGEQGSRVALVVVRGPGQGGVDVYTGGVKVGHVALGSRADYRAVVMLPVHPFTGTVTVRSTGAAPARIDALAVLRG